MVSSAILRNVFGILGNIISFFLFTSPLPTVVEIWKKKSVQQYSAIPYLITLANNMVWMLYGLPIVRPKSVLILSIATTGAALELCYVVVFITFSDKRKKLRLISIVLGEFIFVSVLAVLVLTLAHTTKKRTLITGSIGTLSSLSMYASPLSIMKMVIKTKSVEYMPLLLSFASFKMVIKTKSVEYMPLLLSVASFLSGVVWSFYAFITFDPFIATSNGLGGVLAMAQLILYGVFYKSTKRQIEERKVKGEMGLSQAVVNEDFNKP